MPKRSSVIQESPGGFLGIDEDDWERGVTLDRWARRRDANAYQVASQNALTFFEAIPKILEEGPDILEEGPVLGIQYFDRNDRKGDYLKHVAAHRRLRDLLLVDLRERRCVLGVPPQSATEPASPVSFHALESVIKNINWGIGPPLSSLGNIPVTGKLVYLRLFGPDTFGESSDNHARGTIKDNGSTEVDPYRTGGQGRSSMVHYIKAEFERRHGKGLVESTLAAEARVLLEWAKVKHSKGPIPTLKTIENQIRSRYRKLSKNPTK